MDLDSSYSIPKLCILISPSCSLHSSSVPTFAAIIPRKHSSFDSIIQRYHGGLEGHMGLQRTLSNMDDDGLTWNGRYKDVQTFIQTCPICQKTRPGSSHSHGTPFTGSHKLQSFWVSQIIFEILLTGIVKWCMCFTSLPKENRRLTRNLLLLGMKRIEKCLRF